jgi:hypothetical protein
LKCDVRLAGVRGGREFREINSVLAPKNIFFSITFIIIHIFTIQNIYYYPELKPLPLRGRGLGRGRMIARIIVLSNVR